MYWNIRHTITLLVLVQACGRTGYDAIEADATDVLVGDAIEPATMLGWQESSPWGSTSVTATWTRSISLNLSGQSIQFFDDPGCLSPLGTSTDLQSTVDESYRLTVQDGSTTHFQIVSSDESGVQVFSTCSAPMLVDLSPPQVTSLTINGGALETPTNYVQVSIAGNDFISIVEFCLKYENNTQPTAGDPCWTSVSDPRVGSAPNSTIDVVDFNYALDFVPRAYTVHGWMKDELGHISVLSAAGAGTPAIDMDSIDYYPGRPPVITDILVANSDAPADIPDQADLSVSAGGDVYIKWAAADDEPLPTNPIGLFYATDGESWTAIAENLVNGSNGGCLVDNPGTLADDNATGCYRWTAGAPGATFLQLRVVATDSYGATTFATSVPMNLPQLRFIAGNTEPGLGAHATSSVFYPRQVFNAAALENFVITDNGVVFVNDDRGILRIDPITLQQTLFLADANAIVGEGVTVENATAHNITHMALDYHNGLVFVDQDRIRRIDLGTGIVSTFIGGGTDTSATVNDPLALQFVVGNSGRVGEALFTPLPNGDLLFVSDFATMEPKSIRHYHAGSGQVTSLLMQGVGFFSNATQEISLCRQKSLGVMFNPETSALEKIVVVVTKSETELPACQGSVYTTGGHGFASVDPVSGFSMAPHPPETSLTDSFTASLVSSRGGVLYTHTASNSSVHRYDPVENEWTHILGTGLTGICADGTDALACNVQVQSLFVSARERVFFFDHNMLRTIDDNNRVRTLMGQPLSWGDGEAPLSARVGELRTFGITDAGELIFLDLDAGSMRQFMVDGSGVVERIAGNGTLGAPLVGELALEQPLKMIESGRVQDTFGLDPASGDIFFPPGRNQYHRLDHQTGRWQSFVYGTTYAWFDASAENQAGDLVNFAATYSTTLGFDGTGVLVHKSDIGTVRRPMLKLYAKTDGTQTHLIGTNTDTVAFPTDGPLSPASACDWVRTAQFNAGQWLVVGTSDSAKVRSIDPTTIGTFVQASRSIDSFAYVAADDTLYYAASGQLWAFDRTQSAGNEESQIDLGLPSLQIRGTSMVFHDGGNGRELIFPYVRNGLYGIVAYRLP